MDLQGLTHRWQRLRVAALQGVEPAGIEQGLGVLRAVRAVELQDHRHAEFDHLLRLAEQAGFSEAVGHHHPLAGQHRAVRAE